MYDFRFRFLGRFLGSFLNASSSKVTSLRTVPRAQLWSHGNSVSGFRGPQFRPQSSGLLVGRLVAPTLSLTVALRTLELDQNTIFLLLYLYHYHVLIELIYGFCRVRRAVCVSARDRMQDPRNFGPENSKVT